MKIAFHTLGCKVNQYETEAIKEQFLTKGYTVVNENDFADVYIINSCTVTGLADRKSRQYIRKMKKLNPESVVVVTGCYAQISPKEVCDIEGVNIIAGTNEKNNLVNYVETFLKEKTQSNEVQLHVLDFDEISSYESMGTIISLETRTRAYIKIQEGCNRFCSYCIIPYARGKSRSRDFDEIILEAKGLIEKGFKEIILTGINTALYGIDIGHGGIEPLIKRLNAIPGDFRIRLSSLEPTVINADYVEGLLKYSKLCHHLHLSIQSGSDNVLKQMNRKYTRNEYLEIVKILKDFDPNYGITTDIIVGFPGETDEDFACSLNIVDEVRFCKVHSFKYSKRKGTKATEMINQIPGEIKNKRISELMEKAKLSSSIFFKKNEQTERIVLFEEITKDGYVAGYTDNYIKVYVKSDKNILNNFLNVKLLKEYKDGMKGEI